MCKCWWMGWELLDGHRNGRALQSRYAWSDGAYAPRAQSGACGWSALHPTMHNTRDSCHRCAASTNRQRAAYIPAFNPHLNPKPSTVNHKFPPHRWRIPTIQLRFERTRSTAGLLLWTRMGGTQLRYPSEEDGKMLNWQSNCLNRAQP